MPDIELNDHSYVWTEMEEAIANPANYKWDRVKKTWHDMWRRHKNYDNKDRVFVEKSPSDVGRAHLLSENFENAWFVCQVRNPYVVAEGVARRRGDGDVRRGARHAIKMLAIQKRNIEQVENVIAWKYEDIQIMPLVLEKMVNASVPCLSGFRMDREFYASSVDGYQKKQFSSLNERQLQRLDDRSIRIMNEEFAPYERVMKFFQYDMIGQKDE
jgi:hypothetical protein